MSAEAQPTVEAPARTEKALEFRLLGPLELRRQGALLPLGGGRQRALLALLCLRRGAVVSTDDMVDEVWGEAPPASSRHMVQVYVSKLRKLLGADILLTCPPGYRLDVDPECLDVARFERLLDEGSESLAHAEPDLAAARLAESLDLWRGRALADFSYEPFAQAEIARLEELRHVAEEERIEAELALGRGEEIVSEIEVLVGAEPLRERRHRHLMLALYRAGRQADALAAYRRARETLVEELGIEPGPDLQAMEKAILNQDPAVLAPIPRLPTDADLEARLKLVTILVVELVGHEAELDVELFSREVERLGSLSQETLALHGATTKPLPDGMLIGVFGHPVSHEDDALRAVQAAVRLQGQGVAGIGISTGETIVHAASVTGRVVGSARRLVEQSGGAVVLDELTRDLLAEVVAVEPLSEERTSWRLLELSEATASGRLRLDAPLIGRDRELAALGKALARAVDGGHARLATVIGEPGVGKSRLAHEFAGRVDGQVRLVVGRCIPFGEGITYGPLRDVLRQLGATDIQTLRALLLDDRDAGPVSQRLASLLEVADIDYQRAEIQWAAQRLFAELARQEPLLLLFEDIHWAEPTFLELIAHVVEVTSAPLLAICASRPELLEFWHDWRGATAYASTVEMEPLDERESDELLSALGSGRRLKPNERLEVIATAEGNPLFLEQLSALLSDHRKAAAALAGRLPTSVQALLAARLDRLGPGEVEVIERAAVVGRDFTPGFVSDLLPANAVRTLGRHLQSLVDKRFIVPDDSAPPFERAFSFRHALLQDAAYRRIPKESRARLHERLGDVLIRSTRSLRADHDEVVGYHLGLAYQYRLELGAAEVELHELAARAGEHLNTAGTRAFHRGDLAAASKLLDRATSLLPQRHPQRLEALLALGSALGPLGEAARARTILSDALESARVAGVEAAVWRARLERSDLESQFDTDAISYSDILEEGRRAATACEALGDVRGLARAWRAQAQALHWMGQRDAAAVAAERTIDFADLAGDRYERARGMSFLASALLDGSSFAPDAIRRLEALLQMPGEDRQLAAHIQRRLAALQWMRGNRIEAWRLIEASVRTLEELGSPLALAGALGIERANLHMDEKDFAAAERDRRRAVELLQAHGERDLLPTVWALLAATLLAQENEDEAERFLRRSERGGRHDWVAGMTTKEVRAELHARRGEFDQALRLSRQALAHVQSTDDIEGQAHELMQLSKMLFWAARPGEATPLLRQAVRLFEAKGHVVKAGLAKAALGELQEPTGPRPEPIWLTLR